MLRCNPPFNGKRFLLNKNTGEIHDLDRKTEFCRINDINLEHIYMGDSYMSCLLYAQEKHCPVPNGCFYCQPEKDNG